MSGKNSITQAWRYYENGRTYNNSLSPSQYATVNTNIEFFIGNQWRNLPKTRAMACLPKPVFNIIKRITSDQIIISGLADFGDAEAVGRTDTAVSYAQLLGYTKPLTLNYANGQATGASYADIRKAITRGRQIKLAVANTPDIIASNAKNETDKCVLRFIHTDVGGDAVNITQYTVTAQASGLTVNVKSHEIADGSEVSY